MKKINKFTEINENLKHNILRVILYFFNNNITYSIKLTWIKIFDMLGFTFCTN